MPAEGGKGKGKGKGGSGAARKEKYVQIAADTQRILDRGSYTVGPLPPVDLASSIRQAVSRSVHYADAEPVPVPAPGRLATELLLWSCTTLQAARALAFGSAGERVGVLNFASAKNPGGGWDTGAVAQEETLARGSALTPCLHRFEREFFYPNRATKDGFYTENIIFSPDVPVFKDDEGTLEPVPYPVSFVTAPAVNAGVAMTRFPQQRTGGKAPRGAPPAAVLDTPASAEVARRMTHRIERVLGVFAQHKCDPLILGAYGCGVFRNDPHQVASIFRSVLRSSFKGVFRTVIFAIVEGPNLQSFAATLQLTPGPPPPPRPPPATAPAPGPAPPSPGRQPECPAGPTPAS